MKILYNIFITLYRIIISIVALWNKKAQEWIEGRKGLLNNLAEKIHPSDRIIWMHCASAGELEQGKPVLEALKEAYPGYKMLVTFFSPSGYGAGKKYKKADIIAYLPLDTKKNATKFLQTVKPELVVFVKYEYWYHYLSAVRKRGTPLLLVSAIFRKNQVFFKGYGGFYRKILGLYSRIFVQDEESLQLLKRIDINQGTVGGDTRFDRVGTILQTFTELELIQNFVQQDQVIVAGSTWPEDEQIITAFITTYKDRIKLIVAPHEITKEHINHVFSLFPSAVTYTQLEADPSLQANVLIINNVGMLSRLYRYATITYIGGGFNKSGIHNTLEAAVWGKPVLFGPNYQKFKEARDLIAQGAGYSITTARDFNQAATELLHNGTLLQKSSKAAAEYVQLNKGATEKIMNYIQENRLLTK